MTLYYKGLLRGAISMLLEIVGSATPFGKCYCIKYMNVHWTPPKVYNKYQGPKIVAPFHLLLVLHTDLEAWTARKKSSSNETISTFKLTH